MNRWRRVRALFEQVVDLDDDERRQAIVTATAGDIEVMREVEALLRTDSHALDYFDRGASDLFAKLRDEPPAEALCGVEFGPFRIEEHLSSGGMAHVYRATRVSAGTERRVAIKVLRASLDTDAFLLRFQRERETLAALEHEYIVAFLDAGGLPDGRPYLVMEYVEGVPFTTWGKSASPRARLELFLQLLATIQYAHQQLVVHRDIKPSNVLVTSTGGLKLLDFGVATVLAAHGMDVVEGGPLTPDYASPERLRGDPNSTASDIYSLGVLLHELMTQKLPSSHPDGSEGARLDPDLAAIVSQAIAVDPSRRYRSADHLAHDLRRLLDHEPVAARPTPWFHRARLYARRNRGPLAVAGGLVVALAVGWIGSDLERRLVARDASRGWGAHAESKMVASILREWIVATTASDFALGEEATRYLERVLRDEVVDRPEAETMLRLTLAELYLEQEDLPRALEHATVACELAAITPGVGKGERRRAEELRERAGDERGAPHTPRRPRPGDRQWR